MNSKLSTIAKSSEVPMVDGRMIMLVTSIEGSGFGTVASGCVLTVCVVKSK